MTTRILLATLVLATGCRVDSLEGAEYAGPKNECAVGCPTGATCAGGTCVAEQTTYPFVLEATPPPSARHAAGVTFTRDYEDDRRGGTRDLDLPEPARVSGRLDAGTSLPLVLRLERVGAVAGSAGSVFQAQTVSNTAVPTTPPISVPPGDYYAFVAPANDTDLTSVPPVQLRNDETREPLVVNFQSGPNELRVGYGGSLRKVDIALFDDKGAPLTSPSEARDISVVDLTTGRLASTVAHTCTSPGALLAPEVTLVLAPELKGHRYSLRIDTAKTACSAVEFAVRSSIDYDLHALDVEGRGNRVALTMPTLSTAFVRAKVAAFGKPSVPVEGKIILRSVKLDQPSDDVTGNLSSVVSQPINRDGTVFMDAIPGIYRADIVPTSDVRVPSSAFAICVDCTVPSQDPMAKPGTRTVEFRIEREPRVPLAFEVPQRVQMKASASGFNDALFTVGTWEASSAISAVSFSPGGSALLTRAQTGNVAVIVDGKSGARWNVAGPLDPGLYDLIIRTPVASGYPWIVRPRFDVLPQAALDVGTLTASAPVVITGTVTDPKGDPIPRATVRARALIGDDPKKANAAVLVGETRADDAGRYRLVLPSSLSTAKKEPSPT